MGRDGRIVTPNKLDLTFWVANYGTKFHQNRVRIPTVGEVTVRHTDTGEFIICPLLWTDNNARCWALRCTVIGLRVCFC